MNINGLLPKIKVDDNILLRDLRNQMGNRCFLIEALTYYDIEEVFDVLNKDELEEYLRDNFSLEKKD